MGMQVFDLLVLGFELVQHLKLGGFRTEDLDVVTCSIRFEGLALLLSMIVDLPNVLPGLRNIEAIIFGFEKGVLFGRLLEIAEAGGGEVLPEELQIVVDHLPLNINYCSTYLCLLISLTDPQCTMQSTCD